MKVEILDPINYFAQLGGLHDADLNKVKLSSLGSELVIELDDIFIGSWELPHYPGKTTAQIIFRQVVILENTINPGDIVEPIGHLEVTEVNTQYKGELILLDGTGIRFTFRTCCVELPD